MKVKEYTYAEFNSLVSENNFEVFSKEAVTKFSKDTLEKSQKSEIDEFELNCMVADVKSLTPAIVVNEDLSKSMVYYREAQREMVEIPDGIFKSNPDASCFIYRDTELNRLKGIVGINCADHDAIEKARKGLPIGTEKTFGGKLYIKTEKGWRPKAKGTRGAAKQETETSSTSEATDNSSTKEEKKAPSSIKIEQKTFRIKDGKISASMYDTQSRISKLMKYAKENGLEVEWLESKKKEEPKSYASMDIKDAKKDLVGKKITFKEYFSDGRGGSKDGEGEIKNVRLYGKNKQPIAEIGFPNGDAITISLEQLDKREAAGYKIAFND